MTLNPYAAAFASVVILVGGYQLVRTQDAAGKGGVSSDQSDDGGGGAPWFQQLGQDEPLAGGTQDGMGGLSYYDDSGPDEEEARAHHDPETYLDFFSEMGWDVPQDHWAYAGDSSSSYGSGLFSPYSSAGSWYSTSGSHAGVAGGDWGGGHGGGPWGGPVPTDH